MTARGRRTTELVVVCGLPGVGKTTVAETVADRLDARLLRTDVVRKDILTDPDYTEAEALMVYDEVFERARETVERGRSVVLDGTFKRERHRKRARSLAETLGAEFELVEVECDEAAIERRIRNREGDASDADVEIYRKYREEFDPISLDHATVDNSGGVEDTYRQVARHFDRESPEIDAAGH